MWPSGASGIVLLCGMGGRRVHVNGRGNGAVCCTSPVTRSGVAAGRLRSQVIGTATLDHTSIQSTVATLTGVMHRRVLDNEAISLTGLKSFGIMSGKGHIRARGTIATRALGAPHVRFFPGLRVHGRTGGMRRIIVHRDRTKSTGPDPGPKSLPRTPSSTLWCSWRRAVGRRMLFFFFALVLANVDISTRANKKQVTNIIVSGTNRRPLPNTAVFVRRLGGNVIASKRNRFLLSSIPTTACALAMEFVNCRARAHGLAINGREKGGVVVHLGTRTGSLSRIMIVNGDRTHGLQRRTVPVSIVDVGRVRKAIGGMRSVLTGATKVAIHTANKANDASHVSIHKLRNGHVKLFVSKGPVGSGSSFVSVGSVPIRVVSHVRVCGKIIPTGFKNSTMNNTIGVIVGRCPPGCLSIGCSCNDFGARGTSIIDGVGVTPGKVRFKLKNFCACTSGSCGVGSPFRRKLAVAHSRSGFGGAIVNNDFGTQG